MSEATAIRQSGQMQSQPAGEGPLRIERDGAVLRLILANPPANALSESVLAALTEALKLAHEKEVRVVVIAAEGKLFSGGHDLKELTAHRAGPDHGRSYFEEIFRRCSRVMRGLTELEKPVIAEVAGLATAGGCQLVASCDMVVASSEARFGVNGIDFGLFCSTPMVALSRKVPRALALEMLMTGTMISAERAREAGLVNRVVPPEKLSEETGELVERLLARPASVLALGKKAFREQLGMGLGDAYDFASSVIVGNMMMDEAKEGIGAFVEKREPKW
ncbi:enoyl-CoA hydratase [Afifella sp. IM 167]|uniref:enoyl-CoA hydratase n=1 Tax=Afifella sp. IM 167 TaxID=2033586 RepID=UPI001CCB4923|nr:enoyl-CoA hydratase [Afifella sp. IM 167]MBZ8131699.1 enoyl-CoA hydratase [Afifella sp. IM 167]